MKLSVRDGEIHIQDERITEAEASVPLYEIDQPSQGYGTDVSVAYNNFKPGRNKPRIICSDQMAIFMQLDSPASFEKKHTVSQETIPTIVREYQRVLSNILFLDPIPASMRGYSFKTDRRLQGDGTNLSSALYGLWKEGTKNQQVILNFIQSLPEQAISEIKFLETPRDEVMVTLTETFGQTERDCEAALLSDGTLRVLAIAAAMLSATEGSLVVIEEIDNGVHPSRAEQLLESIQTIATKRNLRVLLSTHNPALMDALPDRALSDVVFCFRDPTTGDSRLSRLGDLDEFPGLASQGPLGHLVTAGIVDRAVKSPETPEDRRQKAVRWLEQLQGQ
ncbi:MAG: ATP-binding protein [Cyanobacteria bacterium J06614_10]